MQTDANISRIKRVSQGIALPAAVRISIPLILFLVLLALPASAQRSSFSAQLRRSSGRVGKLSSERIRQHIARAQSQSLTTSDVSTFQNNLQNLVNWIAQAPSSDPNQQSRVADVQTQISGMTPDEMAELASDTDVVAFNTAVSGLTGAQPTPRILPPSDPPANLFNPQYGVCAPTNGPPSIPSDPTVDKDLLITIEALTALQIVADEQMNLFVAVLGETNNIIQIVVGVVADEIVFALQTASDEIQFCDPFSEAAEVEAGWQNTIVIDTDLASLSGSTTAQFTDLGNQLTAISTDIDNHIASIANNTTTEFPQINTLLTTFSTNLTNENNVVNTDVDSHITAIDTDLDTHLLSVDADVKNTTTSLNTDIDAHAAQVSTDVLARDTTIDREIGTVQSLQVRLEIEHALSSGLTVGIFELPSSQGGYLETLRAIVSDSISKLLTAGQAVGTATKTMALGDTAYASKQYKLAYQNYLTAYVTAVH